MKHHFDSISHSPSCLFVKNDILKPSSIRFILKTSLSLRVKRVTDEDGEVRDGTTRPFGPFSPSVTSPPTWKAGRTDRLPHFPLNSAEKRRCCAASLFSCRNHAENEVRSCAAVLLSLSVGGQVRKESKEQRDEARARIPTRLTQRPRRQKTTLNSAVIGKFSEIDSLKFHSLFFTSTNCDGGTLTKTR